MPVRATKRGDERTPLDGDFDVLICGASFAGLENLDLMGSVRQTFGDLVIHTRTRTFRWHLPWTFSTFDYRELCALLRAQAPDVEFETATVERRDGFTVHTDRG